MIFSFQNYVIIQAWGKRLCCSLKHTLPILHALGKCCTFILCVIILLLFSVVTPYPESLERFLILLGWKEDREGKKRMKIFCEIFHKQPQNSQGLWAATHRAAVVQLLLGRGLRLSAAAKLGCLFLADGKKQKLLAGACEWASLTSSSVSSLQLCATFCTCKFKPPLPLHFCAQEREPTSKNLSVLRGRHMQKWSSFPLVTDDQERFWLSSKHIYFKGESSHSHLHLQKQTCQ